MILLNLILAFIITSGIYLFKKPKVLKIELIKNELFNLYYIRVKVSKFVFIKYWLYHAHYQGVEFHSDNYYTKMGSYFGYKDLKDAQSIYKRMKLFHFMNNENITIIESTDPKKKEIEPPVHSQIARAVDLQLAGKKEEADAILDELLLEQIKIKENEYT